MQISALKKLLQLIGVSETPEEVRPSEEISEQSTAESEKEEFEIQDLEFETKDEEKAISEEPIEEARELHTESNRSHLTSSVPRTARIPAGCMTKGELAEIRALFKNMDDTEIQRLYRRVTKQN